MRKWLKELVDTQYLPAIAVLEDSPLGRSEAQRWAKLMKEQWVAHGMKALKQQRNLMTEVRTEIKRRLGEDHFALESMSFTKAEWVEINQPIDTQVARRNENQQYLDNPEGVVAQAVRLLESQEWAEIAAGLAVLTGRRSSEILATAQFEVMSKWSVIFTGALKRRGESQRLSFEIPTLTTARRVVEALARIRKLVDTKGMDAEAVNDKFSKDVAKVCDRAFGDLVPLREGRDNLYTHLFRSVYATIATHWYCPPRVSDLEFKAQIQGHFQVLDEENPQLRRSLAASRHYSDYEIGDGNGNREGRKGIKLGYAGVQVIEAFKPAMEVRELQELDGPRVKLQKRKPVKVRVWVEDRDRFGAIFERLALEGNQMDRFAALLEWVEQHLEKTIAGGESRTVEAVPISAGAVSQLEAPEVVEQPQTVEAVQEVVSPESQSRQEKPQGVEPSLVETQEAATIQEEAPISPAQTADLTAQEQAWHQIAALSTTVNRLVEQLAHERTELVSSRSSPRSVASPHRAGKSKTMTASNAQSKGKTPVATVATGADDEVPRAVRTTENAEAKVNAAIDAVVAYNSASGRTHENKWAFGVALLKRLTRANQKVIERVVEQRREEIEKHHLQHELGPNHNIRKGRQGIRIEESVPFVWV